jgi:putative ABC transport system permease protein
VLLTIGLGVGATAAVFSVADTLLVRPLPYPNAARIFIARREFVADGKAHAFPIPLEIVQLWRKDARTVETAAAFSSPVPVQLANQSDRMSLYAAAIDDHFLPFAGLHPVIGRTFDADEFTPGGPGAVLLTEQFWRGQYGGSPNVLGRVLQIDNHSVTIIGVVPAALVVPDFQRPRPDVLLPTRVTQSGFVLVRLKTGISPEVATAELDGIFKNANLPDLARAIIPIPMSVRLSRAQDGVAIRTALMMLSGAVALLLVIACINAAHLLLARGAARQRELAVRNALGAGRERLAQQLIIETLVLAVLGGALALGIGWAGLRMLAALRPAQLVALTYVSQNRGLVSIGAALATLIGLVVGLVVAFRIANRNLFQALHVGAPGSVSGGRQFRSALVVGEMALSAMLVIGALLLIHSVVALRRTVLGFDAQGLYSVTFELPGTMSSGERAGFIALMRERAGYVFGRGRVTVGAAPQPRYWHVLGSAIETPEHPGQAGLAEPVAQSVVAPDYFAVLRMPVLAGRSFDEGSAGRNEAIVSQSLAQRLWPNQVAIGRRYRVAIPRPGGPLGGSPRGLPAPRGGVPAGPPRGPEQSWQTVVGVVPDIVQDLVEEGDHLGMYRPLDPRDVTGSVTLLARVEGPGAAAQLKQFAASLRPGGSGISIENVRDAIDESMAEPRFLMRILATFALLGILLAAVGLFGVVAYDVGQRTPEIGVRMTLGATRGDIARLVVGNGLRLALIGIALGLLGAVAATRLIQSLLYGVSRLDPLSYGLAGVVLLAAAVLACLVPTLRATAIEPVIAIRSE